MRKVCAVLLIMLVAVAGCGIKNDNGTKDGDGKKVIKVGFIAPLTGDRRAQGEAARRGFELAIQQYKGDFKILPVIADDRNNEMTSKVARKLIEQDKIVALVSPLANPALDNDNVILLTGTQRDLEPDALTKLTYGVTNLLLNAINNANSDNPVKIKNALNQEAKILESN